MKKLLKWVEEFLFYVENTVLRCRNPFRTAKDLF